MICHKMELLKCKLSFMPPACEVRILVGLDVACDYDVEWWYKLHALRCPCNHRPASSTTVLYCTHITPPVHVKSAIF